MGDFYQSGTISTIHRLPGKSLEQLRAVFGGEAVHRPPAVLIPALAAELDTAAFSGIMESLANASYIGHVVLALGRARRGDFNRARAAMGNLPMKTTVVWPEGPRLSEVLNAVRPHLDVGGPGKGRDVWIALGSLLADGSAHSVALHDADIVTYSEEIPLRLLLPLVLPELDFQFCKGYYARISEGALHGRATRLLVSPLTSVLSQEFDTAALSLVSSMRYPLAGEIAMTSELAARLPVARDWGLEIGTLAAVARVVPFSAICQADLCENYEHKHQILSPEDDTRGLNRMAVEVSETLLREAIDRAPPGDLADRYLERADQMMAMYRADALANALDYDESKERKAVETFASAIRTAMDRLADARVSEPLPPWVVVHSEIPGLAETIREAVADDNAQI